MLYSDSFNKLNKFAQAIKEECKECNGSGVDLNGDPCIFCSAPTPRDLPSDRIDEGIGSDAPLE